MVLPYKFEYPAESSIIVQMNIDTLVSMMLAPILIKLAESFIFWLTANSAVVSKYIKCMFKDAEVTLTATQYLGNDWHVERDENHATQRMLAVITDQLTVRGCTIRTGYTKLEDGRLVITADDKVKYKGYTFTFSITQLTQKEMSYIKKTVVIQHKMLGKIRRFIDKCNTIIANQSDMSYKQHFYGQTKTDKGKTIHKPLVFAPNATFDDLFFPEKDNVISSVDKLIAGKLSKLSFYLHGEPGCGKSTMIKAIAAKTGYSVVEIKLSFMENDNELRNIIFGKRVEILSGEDVSYHEIEISRRIYLFEDIDAESDIVYRRDLKKDKKPPKPKKSSSSADEKEVGESSVPTKQQTLTLSGILNVLDGVIPIRGIVIMTTNHPEKLDPALVRYGRVTHNIRMGRLTEDCAGQLVRKFHPEFTETVPDLRYTPAELEAICQTNNLPGVMESVRGWAI